MPACAIELYPLLRQTGEPVQPAAVPLGRARALPAVPLAGHPAQPVVVPARPPPTAALPACVRRHDPRDLAQPELPASAAWASSRRSRTRRSRCSTTGVDHVHCHFANHPALAGWLIHRLVGIPYSFTAHGSDLHVDRTMLPTKVARGRVRRDDLGRQPRAHRGDRRDRRRRARSRSSTAASTLPRSRPTDRHTATARSGSSRSARSTRSRARST